MENSHLKFRQRRDQQTFFKYKTIYVLIHQCNELKKVLWIINGVAKFNEQFNLCQVFLNNEYGFTERRVSLQKMARVLYDISYSVCNVHASNVYFGKKLLDPLINQHSFFSNTEERNSSWRLKSVHIFEKIIS